MPCFVPIIIRTFRVTFHFSIPTWTRWCSIDCWWFSNPASSKHLRYGSSTFPRSYKTQLVILPMFFFVFFWKVPSLKLTVRTWKWMVGIWSFPFGFRPIFRCENVSFREGISKAHGVQPCVYHSQRLSANGARHAGIFRGLLLLNC